MSVLEFVQDECVCDKQNITNKSGNNVTKEVKYPFLDCCL